LKNWCLEVVDMVYSTVVPLEIQRQQ